MATKKTKLTLAQAEVVVALNQLRISGDELPCFQPSEIFPRRDNVHNGARRTVNSLIRKGLIVERPRGYYPQYQVTQALFDALREWRLDPKNEQAFQSFELSCY